VRQISAAYSRALKEALRDRVTLFWRMSWPIIWLIIASFLFTGDVPPEALPRVRGAMAISMTVFALMISGMSGLPASIALDRKNGLLAKLRSMPVKPYRDLIGRVCAVTTFSLLAAVVIMLLGMALGARFAGTGVAILHAMGFILLVICASAGVGLVIGTLVKKLQGAVMTGVGIAVVTSAMSGLFAPYGSLPAPLQAFARAYPVSSARASIVDLLIGPGAVGYDPLTSGHVALTIALSIALLVVGTVLYSRLGWKLE